MLGVGLAQHVWTDRGLSINRLVPKLKVWNPRHLRWDWPGRRWMLRVAGDKEIEITPGDGTWVLYMPYGDSRPWARGAWRAIALWQTLKTYAIEDWARYSERHGQGTTVAESPENSSKDKRLELAAQLADLGRETTLVLPPGFKYSLVEAVADTWETFQAQKNAADMGMSVAILGQNLSTEVSGPVSTGATLHGRVLQTFIDTDAETLTGCIHDQSLVWWAEFNFGESAVAPWPIYDTKPPEDRKASAEVTKTRADAGKTLASIGAFTVNEVRIAAGHEPLKEGGDEIMKPAPPPAPPGDEDEDEKANENEKRFSRAVRRMLNGLARERARTRESFRRLERVAARISEETAAEFKAARLREDARFDELTRRAEGNETALREVRKLVLDTRADNEARYETFAASLRQTDASVTAIRADVENIRLRSGRSVPARSGFVQGQLYADGLADNARDHAAEAVDEDVAAVLDAIEAGDSYEDVRKRLLQAYRAMSPAKLASLTAKAITMANLAGRHAVNEDV